MKKSKKSPKKSTEKLMVCCVCGEIDDSYSAYCKNCGKVAHRLMSKKQQIKFKKMLKEFK